MSRQVSFLAGPADLPDLERSATSKGMIFIRGDEYGRGRSALPGTLAYFGYFSILPRDKLTLHRGRPCEVFDPILMYRPSYIENGYLTIGNVYENQDNGKLSPLTKPHFDRVARWIRKWPRDAKYGVNIGPHAQELIDHGLKPVNWIPGTVTGLTVDVDTGVETQVDLEKPGMLEKFFNKFRK